MLVSTPLETSQMIYIANEMTAFYHKETLILIELRKLKQPSNYILKWAFFKINGNFPKKLTSLCYYRAFLANIADFAFIFRQSDFLFSITICSCDFCHLFISIMLPRDYV